MNDKNIQYVINEGKIIVNGGDVYLSSLTSIPEGVQFNNGGDVYLRSQTIPIITNYLKRFRVSKCKNNVILYKKVSKNFKTQEDTKNETTWTIGATIIHQNWNPAEQECGAGKFHACAVPFWCDIFRNKKGDKYIAIQININDLYEWTNKPDYPQKIGFRKGKVLYEVTRMGKKIK